MANGKILRGEVYWVSVDDSLGSEIQTGRPAVVVSGDRANEVLSTVIVAYITSQGKPSPSNVSIQYNGEPHKVLCNQIRTVDKQRLTRYEVTLEKPEMIRVTGALAGSMCIPLAAKPVEDPKITELRTECEMWKRAYNITMDRLVEMKVESELNIRMAKVEPEYPDDPELESEVEPDPEPETEVFEPTDINSCSFDDLRHLGFSANIAATIIDGRPYEAISDIQSLPGVSSIMYQLVEKKICCTAVEVEEPVEVPPVEEPVEEKVNINTATARELVEKLSIARTYAYKITGYRNKNGLFVDLEELREVSGLPSVFYERFKDRLTIEVEPKVKVEPKVEEPEEDEHWFGDKLNVNTATADEIVKFTGISSKTARMIVSYRKKNGSFTKLDDLLNVPRFGIGCMKTYGYMLTVGEQQSSEEKRDSEEKQEPEKVNINRATVYELMALGFEKRAAALIVSRRKKYGNYRSVDDLSEVPEISGKILRKLRDKLEV